MKENFDYYALYRNNGAGLLDLKDKELIKTTPRFLLTSSKTYWDSQKSQSDSKSNLEISGIPSLRRMIFTYHRDVNSFNILRGMQQLISSYLNPKICKEITQDRVSEVSEAFNYIVGRYKLALERVDDYRLQRNTFLDDLVANANQWQWNVVFWDKRVSRWVSYYGKKGYDHRTRHHMMRKENQWIDMVGSLLELIMDFSEVEKTLKKISYGKFSTLLEHSSWNGVSELVMQYVTQMRGITEGHYTRINHIVEKFIKTEMISFFNDADLDDWKHVLNKKEFEHKHPMIQDLMTRLFDKSLELIQKELIKSISILSGIVDIVEIRLQHILNPPYLKASQFLNNTTISIDPNTVDQRMTRIVSRNNLQRY